MSRERTVELVGPEGVPLRFELAAVLERAFAFSLDLFFIIVVGVLLLAPALVAGTIAEDAIGIVLLLGLFLVRYFYFFGFESFWRGTTPGKRVLELRVVSRDGGRLGMDAIFARNLTRDIELFLPILVWIMPEALVGPSPPWLWIPATIWVFALSAMPLFTKERVRMGDLVGGTRIVRVPRKTLLTDKAHVDLLAQAGIEFSREQLSVYGEHELETLATLLRTIDDHDVKLDDLRKVSGAIAKRIGYVGPEPLVNPVTFLRSFYRQQRASLERALLFGYRKANKHDSPEENQPKLKS